MINVVFEGGLGNQMFQYVFGRYMQQLFNDVVEYDISKYKFEKNEIRSFELASFGISKDWKRSELKKNRFARFGIGYAFYLIVTAPYIMVNRYNINNKKHPLFGYTYQKIINTFGFYRVHYNEYDKPNRSLLKNKYIRGQWIWKELVTDMDEVVRKELKVITKLNDKNKETLSLIKSTNSVGLHIRRGDYVDLGLIICDIPYYKRCMDKMATMVKFPVFFVFSDDIPWVKENLKTDYKMVFVDNNNSSSEDMRLLYNCNHFIMSNSTFSWWGAYLGDAPDKKVIVPEKWDKAGQRSRLILDDWIVEQAF